MRPHVEIIDEQDLIWHQAEFVHATGSAEQRNLSYDEEDGSLSAKVRFNTDWTRPGRRAPGRDGVVRARR